MARPVIGDFLQDATPIFSPVARPTETFVQPGRKALGGAAALTSALAGLDRVAQPILRQEAKEKAEREIAEGEELFRRNRAEFAEAVRDGTIPAGASPYVRKGYRRSQLHALGGNYSVELARSLEESALYKVDDPAAIEQHMEDFYNQFIETNGIAGFDNRELAQAFSPIVQKAHDGFRGRQAERNIQYIEEERFLAFESEVLATFDMQTFDGSSTQVRTAVGNTAAWLTDKAAELDAEGLDRTKINRTIIDIVTAAAESDEDLDILEVLRNVQLGTGPLSNTKYGREQITRAKDRIVAAGLRRQAAGAAAARRAAAARKEELSLAATEAAIAGDDEAYQVALQGLLQLDASEARSVVNFKDNRDGKREDLGQRAAWAQVHADLAAADSDEEYRAIISEAVVYNNIPYDDANRMLNDRRRQDGKEGTPELHRFLTFGPANEFMSALERSIIGNEFDANDVLRDRAAIAKVDYNEFRLDWYDQNKNEDGTFDRAAYLKAAAEWYRQLREVYVDVDARNENAGFAAPEQAPAWAQ